MNLINIKESNSKKTKSKYLCIGVDFGTTNSVCSIKIDSKVNFINDKFGKNLIPSIVLYDKKNKLVGNEIQKNDKIIDTIFSIKRDFTKNFDEKKFVNEENIKISSIDVAKDIFLHLKKNCDEYLVNKEIHDCVLTVPAYYDEKARSGIMKAAFLAGFNVRRLINEPTAAAFAYGLEEKKRGTFFVYDLGGGTFDVSILKLSNGVFKVIATGGDVSLGGDDFDYFFSKKILKDNFKVEVDDLPLREKKKIVKKCKILKEKLFKIESFFANFEVKKKVKKIHIDNSLLNVSIDELIDKTLKISESLLVDSEIKISSIDGFILVGGSTRLKRVIEKIKKKFKKKVFNKINPDLVVSYGASLHGYELLNGSNNLLLDVTPLSLGIETMGGLMEKIISRNTTIPCIKEQVFTTHENGQTSIKISVLQGERETVENNRSLGEFVLSGLKPKPAGIPRIKVRFSLDADGILFVSANDESSGKENNLTVKSNDNLSISEMRTIVESSISNAKEDVEKRMLIESKIKGKKILNEIEAVKNEIYSICSKKEIENIEKITNMLLKKINSSDVYPDDIDECIEKLNDSTKSFAQKRIDKNFSNFVGKGIDSI